MGFREFLKNNLVILDGGMGTLLQGAGLMPGEKPEGWNLSHPEVVRDIHRAYFDAGSHVVNTNTFGANRLHFTRDELAAVIPAAVENARAAARESVGEQEKFVALDLGPTGKLLRPLGDLDFEEAVDIFAEVVRLGTACGVDLVTVETMNDCYETRAAVLAVKENCDLPVIVTNAYGGDGKLMTGASPTAMAVMLEGLGVDALGANCSLGPRRLSGVMDELLSVASTPVVLKPNAGLPQLRGGVTEYDVHEEEFAAEILAAVRRGVRVAGGCCGTTPAHIAAVSRALVGEKPLPVAEKSVTVVSSYTHAVRFGEGPVLIGERINPTGKKRFKEALRAADMDYILQEGLAEEEAGAHILDVNVGLPEIDEPAMLTAAVRALQAVTPLPLQIDTADPAAMEAALRVYNGKPLINSVSGKRESMDAIFPLVKRYGGVVIALTLDEDGIPATAEGRVAIARRILAAAEDRGIRKKDIIFDPLAMTISTDPRSAAVTLEALRRIRDELGCHTSLGVSNVSFGLPGRDLINGIFFAAALENGLSAAIMNPHSAEMMKTYHAHRALHGLDENCADYIAFASGVQVVTTAPAATAGKDTTASSASPLQAAIQKGLCDRAAALCDELLADHAPMELVQGEIIPALDEVGRGFESGRIFLPQLLMSAEAAAAAFERIKGHVQAHAGGDAPAKGPVVLATVQGDIHDIGKNIVKLLLENYGFTVIDLGRDVPPERVVEATLASGAPLVGLSALMTTTVPAMERTVALLHEKTPARVVVGGAVLTADYAASMHADRYASDAMETVRYAEEVCK